MGVNLLFSPPFGRVKTRDLMLFFRFSNFLITWSARPRQVLTVSEFLLFQSGQLIYLFGSVIQIIDVDRDIVVVFFSFLFFSLNICKLYPYII